uniref:50S ribosomal protein L36 n=1 Tax=candidate division WWE3 bacterium TaxID=2053526 RepID=A0A832E0X6_UNCKA
MRASVKKICQDCKIGRPLEAD